MLALGWWLLALVIFPIGLGSVIYSIFTLDDKPTPGNLIPPVVKLAISWAILILGAGCAITSCMVANKLF